MEEFWPGCLEPSGEGGASSSLSYKSGDLLVEKMDPMLKSGVLQYCTCREPALIQGLLGYMRSKPHPLLGALPLSSVSSPGHPEWGYTGIPQGTDSLTQLRLLYERKLVGPLAYHCTPSNIHLKQRSRYILRRWDQPTTMF